MLAELVAILEQHNNGGVYAESSNFSHKKL